MEITSLSLEEVVRLCERHHKLYMQAQQHESRFCFELFRRAFVFGNEFAWSQIYDQYAPEVSKWIRRHPSFFKCNEPVEYYVGRVFQRMWRAIKPERFYQFPNLPALIKYLQTCVHGEIIDYLKTVKETSELSDRIPASDSTPIFQDEIWKIIRERLVDEEFQLFYLRYSIGMKPREISEEYSDKFNDVTQIYRSLQNILAKLRRTPELQSWLE